MITRLRPAYSPDELAKIYARPHDAGPLVDHQFRIADTVEHGTSRGWRPWPSAADLSCGDGTILRSIRADQKFYGDLAPGYQFQGPLEQTIHEIPYVDLFVCCETLEHLDDPLATLKLIRGTCRFLLLSTPVDAGMDENPEHYWSWSRGDVEAMLAEAGFMDWTYRTSDHRAAGYRYCFGIWLAS